MPVLQPEIECASRDYLHAVQSARLIRMVKNAYEHVPFYKKKLDAIGLKPEDIHTIDDVQQAALYGKNRPEGQLSLRPVRRSPERAGADPRFLGYHRQADGGGIYPPRY